MSKFLSSKLQILSPGDILYCIFNFLHYIHQLQNFCLVLFNVSYLFVKVSCCYCLLDLVKLFFCVFL